MLAESSTALQQSDAFFSPITYLNEREQSKHLHVIELLAVELARSVAEIQPLYEDILTHMQEVAGIRDYLPILVSKRIKSTFRR